MHHYNVCHHCYHQHDQHLKEVQTFVASGDRLPDRGQRGEDPLAVRHVPCRDDDDDDKKRKKIAKKQRVE